MSHCLATEGLVLDDADESALAARFARSESDAFEQLVALYRPRVARLAHRLLGWNDRDVEDVVQDVFLVAMTKAHTFAGRSTVWTWLTAITLNRCRSRQRRSALWRRWRLAFGGETDGVAPASDRPAETDDTAHHVRAAVKTLPAGEREVIVLYYLEQRPVAEISELLRASENAVQVRMHRGRQRLKKSLAGFATE